MYCFTMKHRLSLLSALALGACVATGASVQTVQGVALQVATDEEYFWPASFAHEGGEIDVFPIVTALVVTRRDGAPLGTADEVAARTAVEAHCAGLGLGAPAADSRMADGAWAFPLCAGG
jgi:hypothetical protein